MELNPRDEEARTKLVFVANTSIVSKSVRKGTAEISYHASLDEKECKIYTESKHFQDTGNISNSSILLRQPERFLEDDDPWQPSVTVEEVTDGETTTFDGTIQIKDSQSKSAEDDKIPSGKKKGKKSVKKKANMAKLKQGKDPSSHSKRSRGTVDKSVLIDETFNKVAKQAIAFNPNCYLCLEQWNKIKERDNNINGTKSISQQMLKNIYSALRRYFMGDDRNSRNDAMAPIKTVKHSHNPDGTPVIEDTKSLMQSVNSGKTEDTLSTTNSYKTHKTASAQLRDQIAERSAECHKSTQTEEKLGLIKRLKRFLLSGGSRKQQKDKEKTEEGTARTDGVSNTEIPIQVQTAGKNFETTDQEGTFRVCNEKQHFCNEEKVFKPHSKLASPPTDVTKKEATTPEVLSPSKVVDSAVKVKETKRGCLERMKSALFRKHSSY